MQAGAILIGPGTGIFPARIGTLAYRVPANQIGYDEF